jgi:hypothetical protein
MRNLDAAVFGAALLVACPAVRRFGVFLFLGHSLYATSGTITASLATSAERSGARELQLIGNCTVSPLTTTAGEGGVAARRSTN